MLELYYLLLFSNLIILINIACFKGDTMIPASLEHFNASFIPRWIISLKISICFGYGFSTQISYHEASFWDLRLGNCWWARSREYVAYGNNSKNKLCNYPNMILVKQHFFLLHLRPFFEISFVKRTNKTIAYCIHCHILTYFWYTEQIWHHLESSLLMDQCSYKIRISLPFNTFRMLAISGNFSLRSTKTILWIFLYFLEFG